MPWPPVSSPAVRPGAGEAGITVADVGEFGLIARIVARLGTVPAGVSAALVGPGDDAAVIAVPDGRVVATTDLLVEGRHFRRDWSTGYDVGVKAAAQNLADLAAMGAAPTAMLVGLACPPGLPLSWVDGLTDGLRDEGVRAGCAVVGGDVVRAEQVTLAVTALGDLQGRAPVTRGGARPGDAVCVLGLLGGAAAGLAVLATGKDQGLLTRHHAVVAAHRRPVPPYAAGVVAATLGVTAMIDISDGLLADIGHVAAMSGVAVVVEVAALPRHPGVAEVARELRLDADDLVLTGGEDHALALTVPPEVLSGLQRALADLCDPISAAVVGRVEAGHGVRLVQPREGVGRAGFDHFAAPD